MCKIFKIESDARVNQQSDENHIIVSDDKIYSNCIMKSMRMEIDEFKYVINCKKNENVSE